MDASEIFGKIVGFLFCGGFVVVVVGILVAVAKASKRRQLEMAHGAGGRKQVAGEHEAVPVAAPVEDAFAVVRQPGSGSSIDRTNLQRAFVWAEIVGPPVSERGEDDELRGW